MNTLTYLLQVNIYLALFIGFYWMALKNETFFKQNRIYLNVAAATSFLIPFFNSGWFNGLFITEKVRQVSESVPIEIVYEPVVIYSEPTTTTPADLLTAIYLAGAALFLLRFAIQLVLLTKLLKSPQAGAFSFLKHLKVSADLPGRETIVHHEEVHVRQWHSLDVLLMEIVTIVNWFNPLVYLYKKEIKHIHEFIADEEASGENKQNYAMLLLSTTLGIPAHQLTNSFFNQSLLKRRIYMLSKNRSHRTKLLKYGLCAPLFGFMLILSSAAVSRQATELAQTSLSQEESREAVRKSTNAFLKKHPEIQGTLWSANGDVLEIFHKNGQTSRYDLRIPEEKATLTKIYGTIPLASSRQDKIYNFTDVEQLPQYPGGDEAFGKYLGENLKYPAEAKANNVTGRVIVTFVVEKNGLLGNIKVLRGLGYGTDEEAVRVLKASPNWTPGKKEGQPVRVQYTIPIFFELGKGTSASPKAVEQKKEIDQDDSAAMEFSSVEVLPKFPGGQTGFANFLSETVKYPPLAKENNITGRVIATFIVEKDGSLSNIKILRGLGYGTDEETVRVLRESPKWTPGMNDGKPIRVQYTIPVSFQLGNKPNPGMFKDTNKLIVVDGKIMSSQEAAKIDHQTIKEFKVLEPSEAEKRFGEKGKNGAILVTIKKD